MKVIFGIDYLSRKNTGISSLVENLAKNLNVEGHEIFIAAIKDEYSKVDQEKFSCARVLLIDKGILPVSLIRIFRAYLNFYLKSEADIGHIHSLWSVSSLAIFVWARLKGKPYIISTNGMLNDWALSQSKVKKKIFLATIFERLVRKSDSIIINSTTEKNYLKERGWHSNFHIIPNGVDIPVFGKKSPKDRFACKKLLFLSRVHKKKGIEILLDAWGELFPANKLGNWELAIVGFMDPEHNDYEKYIALRIKSEANLSNVSMSGGKFGLEMWEEYLLCDAFILPTFSEGSAMVVLNAWSAGKLCITTVGSNLEIGLDKKCTILIEANIESVKEGIIKLLSLSDEQLQDFGMVGQNIVKNNYSWKKIADNHIKIYQEAIGKQL